MTLNATVSSGGRCVRCGSALQLEVRARSCVSQFLGSIYAARHGTSILRTLETVLAVWFLPKTITSIPTATVTGPHPKSSAAIMTAWSMTRSVLALERWRSLVAGTVPSNGSG